LSEDERARVLAVLDSPEFADKSPGQVYTILRKHSRPRDRVWCARLSGCSGDLLAGSACRAAYGGPALM
jgi:hypothetical protein